MRKIVQVANAFLIVRSARNILHAGTYKYKKSGKGLQNVDSNFITSKLYINLLATETRTLEEEELFEFIGDEVHANLHLLY